MYCNVCMYVSLHFPFAPQYFPQKKDGFSSVFAKRTSKNIEFFQIFGKRMQEAQASKKAGRGNRAWDPCFATTAPRRLRLVERLPPPPPKKKLIDVGRGGVRGGVILYPLVSIRHAVQCRRILPVDEEGIIPTTNGRGRPGPFVSSRACARCEPLH